MFKSPKFSYGVRIAAGAYLLYLTYELFRDFLDPTVEKGVSPAVSIIGGIAFAIIGILFFISGIRGLILYQEPEDEEYEDEDEDDEEDEIEDQTEEKKLLTDEHAEEKVTATVEKEKKETAPEKTDASAAQDNGSAMGRIARGAFYVNPEVDEEEAVTADPVKEDPAD